MKFSRLYFSSSKATLTKNAFGNIVGKEKNCDNQHFHFSAMFATLSMTDINYGATCTS